jgi:hypothetical protein
MRGSMISQMARGGVQIGYRFFIVRSAAIRFYDIMFTTLSTFSGMKHKIVMQDADDDYVRKEDERPKAAEKNR